MRAVCGTLVFSWSSICLLWSTGRSGSTCRCRPCREPASPGRGYPAPLRRCLDAPPRVLAAEQGRGPGAAPVLRQQLGRQRRVDLRETPPCMDQLNHPGERVAERRAGELGEEALVLLLDRVQVPRLPDHRGRLTATVPLGEKDLGVLAQAGLVE